MKKTILAALLGIWTNAALAAPGDTTLVTVQDHVDMTWYGSYDQTGTFPPAGTTYRKVIMHYALGCASGGCSGWDYTTEMLLRHRPGYSDTTFIQAPNFLLNGVQADSLHYATDSTYTTVWNATTLLTDTLWNAVDTIILFNDAVDPLLPTDTQYVYLAGYYYPVFDANGVVVDSMLVAETAALYLNLTDTYTLADHIDNYELGRVITPYGTYMNPANNGYGTNGYNNTWQQDYYFDVTEYQHMLREEVEMRAFYSGWSSGFSVTLTFMLIEGTPPMDVISLDNLYAGDYNYSNATDFNSVQLPDKNMEIDASTVGTRARIFVTGHGEAGEFTNGVKYYVRANNNTVAQKTIWKDDCGENALWPQGGTWIYDRANWCPGEAIRIFEHDMTPFVNPGQSNVFDINFSSFTPSSAASYSFTEQIIQHAAPNFALDAEMIDILAPTTKDEHSRKNPTCTNPMIKIRNSGAADLTSLTITYGVRGATAQTHTWTGTLKFLETTEVLLPMLNDWNGTDTKFDVSISAPNGGTDGYADNNTYTSTFVAPEVITGTPGFEITLKSNNSPSHNSWALYDANDVVVAQRDNLTANTTYKDTVILASGCYTLTILDLGNDGLQWWANSAQGSGYFRLKKLGETATFKTFVADFGSKSSYTFTFEAPDGVNELNALGRALIFPNPTEGLLTIDLASLQGQVNRVSVMDLYGREVFNSAISQKITQLDLAHLAKGSYAVVLMGVDGTRSTSRVILN